jgi:hypothetical protein
MDLEDATTTIARWQSEAFDRVADYLQRGRSFHGLNDDDLTARWTAAFKAFAAASLAAPSVARLEDLKSAVARKEDLESEFQLRGRDLPFDLVQAESGACGVRSDDACGENGYVRRRRAAPVAVRV